MEKRKISRPVHCSIPRFQEEADKDEQGPSNSNRDKSEGDDGQGGNRQTEKPMQQDQAGGGGRTGHRQEEHQPGFQYLQ